MDAKAIKLSNGIINHHEQEKEDKSEKSEENKKENRKDTNKVTGILVKKSNTIESFNNISDSQLNQSITKKKSQRSNSMIKFKDE